MQYKDFVAHDDNKSLLAMNGRMKEKRGEKQKEIDCVKPYPIFYHYIYYDTFAAVLPISQMNLNFILQFERERKREKLSGRSIKYFFFNSCNR